MADQSSTSRWYGLADSGAPDGNLLAPVGKSEAYKALREQELVTYHQLVRVFHMHAPIMSKQQSRILEDLREMFGLSTERGEMELAMALADPLVESLRSSGVASNRALHRDGLDDLVMAGPQLAALLEQQSDDDHRQEYTLVDVGFGSRGAGGTGNKGGASPLPNKGEYGSTATGGGGGGRKNNTAAAAGASSKNPAGAVVHSALTALGNSSDALAKKYVRGNSDLRGAMKHELLEKLAEAEATLQSLTEANGADATSLTAGRATPRGN